MTADEIAYEKYLKGEYTYSEYCVVCFQEECEPQPPKKESAITDFMTMIKESWTWDRLTEKEKNRFEDLLIENRVIKGDFKTRWCILNAMYNAFLIGLGYEPVGWRE